MSSKRNGPLLRPEEVLARYTSGPKDGVFTDGACEGNPGPGGWAYVWVEGDRIRSEKHGSEAATTNNRMELTALIEAYRALPANARVTVHSDSELCVKTVNEWAAGWERNGWRRKTGPIANLSLVQTLFAPAKSHPNVSLVWIRAHDGTRWNEYVDSLANSFLFERQVP
jgi:ribonuclease HI